jgi:NAD(P)-dependent dehydrogenase (short-subunit alcohol dehydrogenase family)
MSQLRVLITGGSRGIGRAIALRFAREGAHVVVNSRSSDQLDAVVAEIEAAGGRGTAGQVNVADWGSVEGAIFRATQATGGPIDILINCAGTFDIKPFDKMDTQTWENAINVNLTGAFQVTLECLEALEQSERAHIFMINSIAGRQGFPGNTAYCASKYGLRGFTDALRMDLADKGIRVSSVFAGQTDTSIWDRVEGDWDRSKMNRPEDVAEVVWAAYNSESSEDVDDLEVPPPA